MGYYWISKNDKKLELDKLKNKAKKTEGDLKRIGMEKDVKDLDLVTYWFRW